MLPHTADPPSFLFHVKSNSHVGGVFHVKHKILKRRWFPWAVNKIIF